MAKNTKVSVFDLKEGKVYKAFKGEKELKRKFFKKDGELYNDANQEVQGTYSGCAYIPPGRAYKFEEIKKEKPKKVVEKKKVNEFSVIKTEEGTVYKWMQGYLSGNNFVLRHKQDIFFCDKHGNRGAKIKNEAISLDDTFIPQHKIESKQTQPKSIKSADMEAFLMSVGSSQKVKR